MKQASIELHIEELVLDGFASGDRYRIGDALESELARLFAEQGVPASLTESAPLEQLSGPDFRVARNSSSKGIGSDAAQAVYRGLGR